MRSISKNKVIQIAVFLPLIALYITWSWSGEISDFGGDSAGYLLAAQYFSPYSISTDVLSEYSKEIIYPPLFPVLLALLGGGESILIANLIAGVLVSLGAMALYAWLRAEAFPAVLAWCTAVIFALLPATYLQALNIWTEHLFVLASLLSFFAFAKFEKAPEDQKWLLLTATAVAAATLTRVAALPLLAAFLLVLLIRKQTGTLLAAAAAAIPFALWVVFSAVFQTGIGAYLSHWMTAYGGPSTSTGLGVQIPAELDAILDAWRFAWVAESQTTVASLVTSAIGVVCLLGFLVRLWRKKLDGIYTAIYLVQLILWPHPEEALRYASVLFPVLLAHGALFVNEFIAAKSEGMVREMTLPALLIVMAMMIIPPLLATSVRFAQKVPEGFREAKHTEAWYSDNRLNAVEYAQFHSGLLRHLKSIRTQVPEGACIFAIKPTVVTLYTGRMSYGPPKTGVSESEFSTGIRKCNYAYVLPFSSPSYREPMYPVSRLGEQNVRWISNARIKSMGPPRMIGALIEIAPAKK